MSSPLLCDVYVYQVAGGGGSSDGWRTVEVVLEPKDEDEEMRFTGLTTEMEVEGLSEKIESNSFMLRRRVQQRTENFR
ncbi:hypothetical protein L6452_06870 [Arctium lappa]|uniref:Uncharacterized protein n=1 Tax=Arctium lappa TaxID=4217 RepID=A0ACB9EKT8_ARCLA|nr:hypothetical protein L6452_06870 [Arctium lappa]